MKERPILFSAPMVKAILAGTKTQTRRVVKHQPHDVWPSDGVSLSGQNGTVHYTSQYAKASFSNGSLSYGVSGFSVYSKGWKCPYGQPLDRLWVRETGWERPERTPKMMREGADTWARYYYDADGENSEDLKAWGFKRRPSIFMPRWASRITLEVTGVRVERLNAISEDDCWAEGIDAVDGVFDDQIHATAKRIGCGFEDARATYACLFESINGKGTWDANPYVWVLAFHRIEIPK